MKKRFISALLAVSMAITMLALPIYATPAPTWQQQRDQEKQEVDNVVREIMKTIPKGASDFQKIHILYLWMINNVKYDYPTYYGRGNNAHAGTVYGALVEKYVVCGGYTNGFERLLNEVGIQNMITVGYLEGREDDGAHAWNIVKLNGGWYHIDTTWDAGRRSYKYFLRGANFMNTSHKWADGYPQYGTPDCYASQKRNIGLFSTQMSGDNVYFIGSGKLRVFNTLTGKSKAIDDAKGYYSGEGLHGDYWFYRRSDQLNYGMMLYHVPTGKIIEIPKHPNFDRFFIGIEGDLVFFETYERSEWVRRFGAAHSIIMFNAKTGEIQESPPNRKESVPYSVSVGYGGLLIAGIHNGIMYYCNNVDIFSYDIEKNIHRKLRRPDGIVIEPFSERKFFKSIEIVERNGKTYLKWDIASEGVNTVVSTQTRLIG